MAFGINFFIKCLAIPVLPPGKLCKKGAFIWLVFKKPGISKYFPQYALRASHPNPMILAIIGS